MLKLTPLIFESDNSPSEEDLGKPHILTEQGFIFLKSKIDDLNKKAARWGVPPLELKVIREFFDKKTFFVNLAGKVTTSEDPEATSVERIIKKFEVEINGESPRVEGYEFIAKIQHTPEGNILNYAPQASQKTLPITYRTASQQCDVCKTTRDRNNTFILKLEKEDPQRFPGKNAGDFIMVGSGCLKRFLPNISVNALLGYAAMIEIIRSSIKEAGNMDDYGGYGSGRGNYISQNELGFWLAAVYLFEGKYLSKKKAEEFQTSSTLDQAWNAMLSKSGGSGESKIHLKVRTEEEFKQRVDKFKDEFLSWTKTKNFDEMAAKRPDAGDFFHNMKIISKTEVFKTNNSGLFSALFQVFLMDKNDQENKAKLKAAHPNLSYIGQPSTKQKAKVKVSKIKEYEGSYGPGLIVNMTAESTEKNSAGQDEIKHGNLLYFTGDSFELEEGEEAEVEFTVKGHAPNKFTSLPETQITRMKVLKFITNPEKNAGKQKVKDMSGIVEVSSVYQQQAWDREINNYRTRYWISFRYSTEHHPDMTQTGAHWGLEFQAELPDESSYNQFKPYEKKLVEATWSLARSMTMDKLKSYGTSNVVNFKITKVLGDLQK